MRICIYGAGAIGGYLAAQLHLAGVETSLVARGPHLAAIKKHGLRLRIEGGERVAKLPASDDPGALGPQDAVIVTLKAHSVPGVVDGIASLLDEDGAIVSAVNGVPWWYFYKNPGPWRDRRIESVDPGGRQWDVLKPERVIGCVVYPACEIAEPGVVTHVEGDRFSLGEPDGEKTPRIEAISAALRVAGFRAPIRPRIRDEIWVKLWGNLTFNPLSALTGADLAQLCGDEDVLKVIRAMMSEGQMIGEALGVRFPVSLDKRIAGAKAVGAHKPSMLQDLERGRPMEIDALVGAVQELGVLTGVATPVIDTVLALVRQRARLAGCY